LSEFLASMHPRQYGASAGRNRRHIGTVVDQVWLQAEQRGSGSGSAAGKAARVGSDSNSTITSIDIKQDRDDVRHVLR
jgi:hypothetical protein